MPTRTKTTAPGKKLAAQRAKARRKVASKPAAPKARAKRRKPSEFERQFSEYRAGFERVKGSIRTTRASAAKRKARQSAFASEPKAVQAYIKRAVVRGQTTKRALDIGRVLYKADKLNDNGTLKTRGMKKPSRLRKLFKL